MGKKDTKKATGKVTTTAKDVAKAMAENMAANQQDPNFELDRARMQDEAAKKALEKHGLHPDKTKKKPPTAK